MKRAAVASSTFQSSAAFLQQSAATIARKGNVVISSRSTRSSRSAFCTWARPSSSTFFPSSLNNPLKANNSPTVMSANFFHSTTITAAGDVTSSSAATTTATTTATAAGGSTDTVVGSMLSSLTSIFSTPAGMATSVVGLVSLIVYWKYKGAIQRRLKQIQEESWLFGAGVTMIRGPPPKSGDYNRDLALFSHISVLEVNPEFRQTYYEQDGWQLVGLGEYLATLRPKQLPKNFSTQDLPSLLQQELEAGLAQGLLKALGPNLGRALLPAVGFGPIQGQAQSLATSLATRWILSRQASRTTTGLASSEDRAGLPISILTLLALSENNAKFNSSGGDGGGSRNAEEALNEDGKTITSEESDSAGEDKTTTNEEGLGLKEKLPGTNLSSMDKMKQGENVNGPTFDEDVVPMSGFVLMEDFHKTIRDMEVLIRDQGHDVDTQSTELQTAQAEAREENGDIKERKDKTIQKRDSKKKKKESTQVHQQRKDDDDDDNVDTYNPNDCDMGEPVPINPRLFPDLHLGYGNVKCSHTKRQILQMRLLSVLLNRLGSNYHRLANPKVGESLFTMKLTSDGPMIVKPSELIQGLIDMGQQITVVPTSRMTSFGIGLSIKEQDGSWSNIPLGVFLESGYEDVDGNMAPVMMPHSGLRLIVGDGPLTDNQSNEYEDYDPKQVTNPLIIQHFIGIEGFCGWKSDQNPEVPFNQNVDSGRRLMDASEVTRAVRLAGLYGTILNGIATDLGLPFGGYGVTAVCNDSAAVIQQCLYGESYIFPLSSIGRYLQRTLRYGHSLDQKLQHVSEMLPDESEDMQALLQAMRDLPSDINSTPANASNAARRLLTTMQPERPLSLMNDSKRIMESIMKEEKEEEERRTKVKAERKTDTVMRQ